MLTGLFKVRSKPFDFAKFPCSQCGTPVPSTGKKAHRCPACDHGHASLPSAPVDPGLESVGGIPAGFLARVVDRLAAVAPEGEGPTLADAMAYARLRFGLPTPLATPDDRRIFARSLPTWLVVAADDDAERE